MKKIFSLLSTTFLLTPTFLIACQKNDFNQDKYHFIEKNNFANDYKDFSYLANNYVSKNIHEINLATSAKLFRIKSSNQPLIDFRDNIVIIPSELSYKFEWANQINISTENNDFIFSNDEIDDVQYEYENDNKENGIFKPKKEKGNGFDSPFLFIPSSNQNSINHNDFKKALQNAKSIEIKSKNLDNVWIDYKNKQANQDNKININSFRLGLFANLLKNKSFRHGYVEEKSINIDQYKDMNNNIDGFDLYQYLYDKKIDIKKLFDFSEDSITLKTLDDSFVDWTNIFENLFIIQNYFDAIPFEIIYKNYGNPMDNINWFFEYGKSFKDRLFASNYYISKMDNNETILNINKNYINNEKNIPNKITIQYNSLPLSPNTFSLQSVNAFKQNIISKIDYETLNIDEKQFILNNFKKYNFSYLKNYNRFSMNNPIIINYSPNLETKLMNKTFIKMFYGLNESNNLEIFSKNIWFQSLFNNLINQYALVENSKDIWLSQAPENLKLEGKNKVLNIEEIKDAFINISKPIIFDHKGIKIKNTFQYQNKNNLTNPNLIFIEEKIKSNWFDEISKSIKNILNDFFTSNTNDKEAFVNIPILIKTKNQFVEDRLRLIKKIFNSIDRRLKIEITPIDNFEKYNIFFKSNNSIYKESKFNIFEGNSVEYLYSQILNKENNLSILLNTLFEGKEEFKEIYKELIVLKEFLNLNKIDITQDLSEESKSLFRNYLSNLKIENQLNLINEISNLISYTISFDNQINIDSYSKIVFQKHFEKPIGWNNLNYFQDIKIKGEINE